MDRRSPDFALCSRRIVTADRVVDGAVIVRSGVIDAIVPVENVPDGVPMEDVGNSVVMPGLVDTHVHINEPGRTGWEGFATATRAAAAGGVTTLVEMPLNSIPATTNRVALEEKVEAAQSKLMVDCGFYGGVIPGNAAGIRSLVDGGVFGLKAFLIDSGVSEFPAVGESDLRDLMPVIASTDVPLLVHAELQTTGHPDSRSPTSPASYKAYLASRPRRWENDAIDLALKLGEEYGCRVHIVHLSSSEALPALERARRRGLPVTVETCPHYLFFCAEEIEDGNTLAKCAPPIRERENRDRLWQALSEGTIDFVVSDHSPAPPEMKCLETGDLVQAWGGIASLQLGLAAVWTKARDRGFSAEDIATWMGAGPARFVGLYGRKGVLQAGADADMVVWNPEASFTVSPEEIFHRHKHTPYDGIVLFGVVEKTFLRGEPVFDGKAVVGSPRGRILRRRDHDR